MRKKLTSTKVCKFPIISQKSSICPTEKISFQSHCLWRNIAHSIHGVFRRREPLMLIRPNSKLSGWSRERWHVTGASKYATKGRRSKQKNGASDKLRIHDPSTSPHPRLSWRPPIMRDGTGSLAQSPVDKRESHLTAFASCALAPMAMGQHGGHERRIHLIRSTYRSLVPVRTQR
jgi:hypothetical protein